MTSDSSIPKSQFVNGLRSPTAIRDRSSDWELNPSRRAIEHGKLVKRQKSTVSTLGTKESRLPPTPPSFRINADGTIMREDASNDSGPASTPLPEKSISSSSYRPISENNFVGCSCFNSFGFRFRGIGNLSPLSKLRSDPLQGCSLNRNQHQHQTCCCSGMSSALINYRHSRREICIADTQNGESSFLYTSVLRLISIGIGLG